MVERVARPVLSAPEVEDDARRDARGGGRTRRLVEQALDSRLAAQVTDHLLQSPELERAVEQIASSAAVRAALANQTTSLAEDLAAGVPAQGRTPRRRSPEDSAPVVTATVAIQPGLSESRMPCAGVATRAVALAADLLVIHVFILVIGGLLGLVATLVGDLRPQWLVATIVGAASGAHRDKSTSSFFWSVTGQTPGMRAMRLVVVSADGTRPSVWRAFVRLIGLLLAIVPLFAGFLPVLLTRDGARLPDYLARTVVLYTERTEAHGVVTGGP